MVELETISWVSSLRLMAIWFPWQIWHWRCCDTSAVLLASPWLIHSRNMFGCFIMGGWICCLCVNRSILLHFQKMRSAVCQTCLMHMEICFCLLAALPASIFDLYWVEICLRSWAKLSYSDRPSAPELRKTAPPLNCETTALDFPPCLKFAPRWSRKHWNMLKIQHVHPFFWPPHNVAQHWKPWWWKVWSSENLLWLIWWIWCPD